LIVERTDFISVPVRDLERSTRFYEETLGLPKTPGDGAWPEFLTGNVSLYLIDPTNIGQEFKGPHTSPLALRVADVAEARRELEAKGRRFRSATDTEVILAAYEEWGESCVERFNGMWAIALWDGRRRKLFCSRDRFGVKPFYYRWDGGRLVFASELKAFRADRATRLEPNPAAVRDYLEQGYVDHNDDTFFSGIVKLPPAHSLTLDDAGVRVRRYWRLEQRDAPADAVAAVRELFLDSVRLRLRSDVPVGTCLSGGIDSSAIACAVDRLLHTEHESAVAVGERQRTFTAYFDEPGFDERPYARAVIDRIKAEPHRVSFTAAELVSDLPSIVRSQDEPFGSTSICAGWYVMRAAGRAGLKVMLDGQGGDEVLAGYRTHLGHHLADLLASGRVGELGSELRGFRDLHGAKRLATALAQPFAPERVTRAARARWVSPAWARAARSTSAARI